MSDDDGKDVAFDAPATSATIARITDESKGFKTRAQTAEEKLKAFDGIDDPKAAKDALAKVANWGDKELVEAGKVEEIKAAAIKAVEDKYKPVVEENTTLKIALHGEKIGGSFARSKFIADKIAVPADIVQARFGTNFKLEDGKSSPTTSRATSSTPRPAREIRRASMKRSNCWSTPIPTRTRSSRAPAALVPASSRAMAVRVRAPRRWPAPSSTSSIPPRSTRPWWSTRSR
jgi:hypothetical protein